MARLFRQSRSGVKTKTTTTKKKAPSVDADPAGNLSKMCWFAEAAVVIGED